jgi:ribonuclease P protein component
MVPLPEDVPAQAAFSVPKRNFKRAVDRNRIKRLMKEVYRLNKREHYLALSDNDVQVAMMFVFIGKEKPEMALVEEKIKVILQRFSTEILNSQKA